MLLVEHELLRLALLLRQPLPRLLALRQPRLELGRAPRHVELLGGHVGQVHPWVGALMVDLFSRLRDREDAGVLEPLEGAQPRVVAPRPPQLLQLALVRVPLRRPLDFLHELPRPLRLQLLSPCDGALYSLCPLLGLALERLLPLLHLSGRVTRGDQSATSDEHE